MQNVPLDMVRCGAMAIATGVGQLTTLSVYMETNPVRHLRTKRIEKCLRTKHGKAPLVISNRRIIMISRRVPFRYDILSG